MERLPTEVCLNIFCWLDHQNLAAAQQVCKKWNALASENTLWSNLFKERWGHDRAAFYAPGDSKLWKHVYEIQDRCDRIGLGLKIIREGGDYYLVHQGEVQSYLGSRRQRKGVNINVPDTQGSATQDVSSKEGELGQGILDRILFFIGDLEVASTDAKRRCVS